MDAEMFPPLLTAEIPLPVVEPGEADAREGPLPRSLAQAAGLTRAKKTIGLILGVLLVLVAVEAALLVRVSKSRALVVYQAGSQARLVAR